MQLGGHGVEEDGACRAAARGLRTGERRAVDGARAARRCEQRQEATAVQGAVGIAMEPHERGIGVQVKASVTRLSQNSPEIAIFNEDNAHEICARGVVGGLAALLAGLLSAAGRARVRARPTRRRAAAATATAARPPRRPTRCRRISWPRRSPSAASATFWTLPDRFGVSPCCGCCWPRAAPPGWRVGRRGFRGADGCREWYFSPPSLLSLRWPAFRWTGSGTTMNALWDQRAGMGELVWRPGQGAGADDCCSARRFCCSSTGLCGAGRGGTGSGSGWSPCRFCFSLFAEPVVSSRCSTSLSRSSKNIRRW